MSPLQAIIFDMDGVLLDSEPLHLIAMQRVLAAAGQRLDEAEYRDYIGDTVEGAWRLICVRRRLPDPPPVYMARYDAAVVAVVAEAAVPMPGLLPLLADLRAAGVRLAVGSTSPGHWITASLAAIGATAYFAACVGGDQVAHHKPAPDTFLRAAALLAVPPAACAVIEDSARGLLAARAAGMRAVALQVPGALTHSPIPRAAADLSVPSLAAFHAWWQAQRAPA